MNTKSFLKEMRNRWKEVWMNRKCDKRINENESYSHLYKHLRNATITGNKGMASYFHNKMSEIEKSLGRTYVEYGKYKPSYK